MIELNCSIFDLAIKQIEREGKLLNKNALELIIDRAIRIRHYLDMVERNRKVTKKKGGE